MSRRTAIAISLAIVGAMAALSAWAWLALPDGPRVPVHWDIEGRADAWADKSVGLAVLPLTALGLAGLFAILPSIEPRRMNLERSWRAYRAMWLSTIVLLLGLHVGVILVGFDAGVDISRLLLIGVGLLLMIIGNYLPTMRSNWFVGIRTPWTLASERSWEQTHRVGGRLFVLVGIATALSAAFDLGGSASFIVAVGGIGLVAVSAIVYSFLVWRSDPDRRTQ